MDYRISRHAEEQPIVQGIGRTLLDRVMQSPELKYNPAVDILRIRFNTTPVFESDEDKPGVILDYDSEGRVVGMEILDASKRIVDPRVADLSIAA